MNSSDMPNGNPSAAELRSANIYRRSFSAVCPNNGVAIDYALQILHRDTIMVEDIVAATTGLEAVYHEELADRLWERFGGVHTLTAHHHGVDIETRRSVG